MYNPDVLLIRIKYKTNNTYSECLENIHYFLFLAQNFHGSLLRKAKTTRAELIKFTHYLAITDGCGGKCRFGLFICFSYFQFLAGLGTYINMAQILVMHEKHNYTIAK